MTSRARANLILGVVGAAFATVEAGLYLVLTRPRLRSWGATEEEQRRPLPGDELGPSSRALTQAITIDAPPAEVWPWLVQMGQGRGGFYTHAWPEKLTLTRIQNAETVVPEWQRLEVGDLVRTYWDLPFIEPLAWHVRTLEPEHVLVLDWQGKGESGWAFVLEPLPHGRTRLLARDHAAPLPRLLLPLELLALEPLHLYQTTGTLQGLKRRIERRRGHGAE